jgi:hypothetical protein
MKYVANDNDVVASFQVATIHGFAFRLYFPRVVLIAVSSTDSLTVMTDRAKGKERSEFLVLATFLSGQLDCNFIIGLHFALQCYYLLLCSYVRHFDISFLVLVFCSHKTRAK